MFQKAACRKQLFGRSLGGLNLFSSKIMSSDSKTSAGKALFSFPPIAMDYENYHNFVLEKCGSSHNPWQLQKCYYVCTFLRTLWPRHPPLSNSLLDHKELLYKVIDVPALSYGEQHNSAKCNLTSQGFPVLRCEGGSFRCRVCLMCE